MPDPTDFLDDENWHGGYYELAIDLGEWTESESDARVDAALKSLWSEPTLEGCYLDRWHSRSEQPRVSAVPIDVQEPVPLYGVATLPDGRRVVCVSHVIRETVVDVTPHDWLDLCLPMGALERVDDRIGGYPFGEDRSLDWREPIDAWFFRIASNVFEAAGLPVALMGFEVSGDPAADDPKASSLDERPIAFARPTPEGLKFLPATE